jgi:hypothetical protein
LDEIFGKENFVAGKFGRKTAHQTKTTIEYENFAEWWKNNLNMFRTELPAFARVAIQNKGGKFLLVKK